MENKKTKYIKVKMSPEELRQWKAKAEPFGTVTNYVRSAVAEFSNVNARERIELLIRVSSFYDKWSAGLGHIGGNLNQAVKRGNELAQAGLLSAAYMNKLLAAVREAQSELSTIKRELLTVHKKGAKL